MRATAKFNCKGCGTEVVRLTKQMKRAGRYCSAQCYYKTKREASGIQIRKCSECGARFQNRQIRKYCSNACFLSRSTQRKKRICASCGEEFQVDRPGAQIKYCSRRCMGMGLTKPAIQRTCPNCNNEFTHRQMGERTRVYCSNECKREHYRDENHPSFRGNRRQYRGKDWKTQSALARIRDMNICANCGDNSEKNISVDHIVPFRLCKRFGDEKNPNDLINLICLCRVCHSRKTQMERTVLQGDIMGFISKAKAVVDRDRLIRALHFWRLYRDPAEVRKERDEHSGGKPVPKREVA